MRLFYEYSEFRWYWMCDYVAALTEGNAATMVNIPNRPTARLKNSVHMAIMGAVNACLVITRP